MTWLRLWRARSTYRLVGRSFVAVAHATSQCSFAPYMTYCALLVLPGIQPSLAGWSQLNCQQRGPTITGRSLHTLFQLWMRARYSCCHASDNLHASYKCHAHGFNAPKACLARSRMPPCRCIFNVTGKQLARSQAVTNWPHPRLYLYALRAIPAIRSSWQELQMGMTLQRMPHMACSHRALRISPAINGRAH